MENMGICEDMPRGSWLMGFCMSPKQGVSGVNFPENFCPSKQFTAFFVVPKIVEFGSKSCEIWLKRAVSGWEEILYQLTASLTARALKPPVPLKNVALMGKKGKGMSAAYCHRIGGSYNYSESTEKRNAENLLIIRDHGIIAEYRENWHVRKQISRPLTPRP